MANQGMVKVKILGAKRSAANIRKMSKAVRKKFFEELVEIAEAALLRAKSHYVPVDTGALQRSANQEVFPGYYPSTVISFGGPEAPYAAIQHENLQFRHRAPQRAKYLEVAVKEFEPIIKKKLAVAARTESQKYRMSGVRI